MQNFIVKSVLFGFAHHIFQVRFQILTRVRTSVKNGIEIQNVLIEVRDELLMLSFQCQLCQAVIISKSLQETQQIQLLVDLLLG